MTTIRIFIGAFLAAATGLFAAEPEEVGDLGSPSALRFEGVESFPVESIRRGLRNNPVFIPYSHPLAPYADFRKKVAELVKRGFLNEGFPDATVETTCDEAGSFTRVTVSEGHRFMKGQLVIAGDTGEVPRQLLRTMLTQATDIVDPGKLRFLRNRLHHNIAAKTLTLNSLESKRDPAKPEDDSKIKTEFTTHTSYFGYAWLIPGGPVPEPGSIGYDPSDDPFWKKGEPVSFSDAVAEKAAKNVDATLEELGYLSADADVTARRNTASGTIDLSVTIKQLGPRATLGQVQVDGLERHQPDEVREFLGLENGTHFSRALLLEAERRLIDSGRFIAHWFEIHKRENDPDTLDLTLTVSEFLKVPKLGDPLSAEQEAILRFSRWISTLSDQDMDLVCRIRELPVAVGDRPEPAAAPLLDVELILSPADGLGILSGEGPDLALVFGGEQFGVYQASDQAKSRSISPPFQGRVTPQVTVSPNGESQTGNTINLSFSTNSKRPEYLDSPLDAQVYFAPVACLQMLDGEKVKMSQPRPGILAIRSRDESSQFDIEIEMETGRLLSIVTNAGEEGGEFMITSRQGALKQALEKTQVATASLPNDYDEDRPVISILGPVIRSVLQSDLVKEMADRRQLDISDSVLSQLDNAAVTAPFESLILAWWGGFSPGETFAIPVTPDEFKLSANQMVFAFATSILGSAEPQLPKDSWLWKVIRETIHLLGQSPHSAAMLDELDSEAVEMGPVGYLVTAQVLKLVGSPQAYRFAWGGLERLEAGDFRDDWRFLFDSESPSEIGIHAVGPVEALGKIYAESDDPQTQNLGRDLIAAAADFRAGKSDDFLELTGTALDKLWVDSGQAAVESGLRSMLGISEDLSVNDLAAAVNGRPIFATDVRAAAILEEKEPEAALESLIAQQPLHELFERLGGKFPPELIDQRLNQLVAEKFGGSKDRFKAALAEKSITLDQVKRVIGIRIAAEGIRGKVMGEFPEPTDEQLEAFLEKHGDSFTMKPAVRLHTIAVKKSEANREAIEAARKMLIEDGKKFAEAARKLSEDSKSEAGGDWGWVERGQFNQTVAAEIGECETGNFSPIIEDGDFYRLIHVSDRRKAGPPTLDRLNAKSRAALAQAVRAAEFQKWEAAQRENRYLKRFK